jgi:hypothetical protein
MSQNPDIEHEFVRLDRKNTFETAGAETGFVIRGEKSGEHAPYCIKHFDVIPRGLWRGTHLRSPARTHACRQAGAGDDENKKL